jgi:hypothetical protein
MQVSSPDVCRCDTLRRRRFCASGNDPERKYYEHSGEHEPLREHSNGRGTGLLRSPKARLKILGKLIWAIVASGRTRRHTATNGRQRMLRHTAKRTIPMPLGLPFSLSRNDPVIRPSFHQPDRRGPIAKSGTAYSVVCTDRCLSSQAAATNPTTSWKKILSPCRVCHQSSGLNAWSGAPTT